MTYTVNAYYKHEHGDQPVMITTSEDVDALVDALLQERLEDNSVAALYVQERPRLESGYPDHELRIAVNADTKVGGLRYAGSDGTSDGVWYARGKQSTRDEVWYCYMGNDEEFPRDSEISLDELRTGAKEFLESGGKRPQSVRWREAAG
jgi:Immunity protein Imm1